MFDNHPILARPKHVVSVGIRLSLQRSLGSEKLSAKIAKVSQIDHPKLKAVGKVSAETRLEFHADVPSLTQTERERSISRKARLFMIKAGPVGRCVSKELG